MANEQYNEHDAIIAFQAAEAAFAATPIGAAFNRFKSSIIKAWVNDTEDSFTDKDRKTTKEAFARVDEAERELKALLNDLMRKSNGQ